MKKIYFIICVLLYLNASTQNLDTVTVNLTLRSGDWAFIAGSMTANDSSDFVFFRRLRDTARLANPVNYTVNVRMNSIKGSIIYNIYTFIKGLPATLEDQAGTTIVTNIKAIANTTLQNFITAYDNQAAALYIQRRTRGKNLLLDN